MGYASIQLQPGFVRTDSPYSLRGRFVDGNWVRFVRDKVEKVGGFVAYTSSPLDGICRALFAWDDFALNRYIALGTSCKLYIADRNGALTDITPLRTGGSGTLAASPFQTTNASSIVTVTHNAHGLEVGAHVIYSGATLVGGLDLNGEWMVTEVVDANHYKIDAGQDATSGATGGGTPDFEYLIPCGQDGASTEGGYGTGTYGMGTYGTPRVLSEAIQLPTFWFIENYGQYLLSLRNRGTLYMWNLSDPRAQPVANAPASGEAMFITDERFPVILGADGDLMRIRWPDQNDITNWTPAETNTANIRNLQGGSRLIAGKTLGARMAIIWSDVAAFQMLYTASQFVYETRRIGLECGLIGPKAFAIANAVAFWMSGNDFHMSRGGDVQRIPNADDVRAWVFGQADLFQSVKTCAFFNVRFNEIWWVFVPFGQSEPARYVKVNIQNWAWDTGFIGRSAWCIQGTVNHRVFGVDGDQLLYWHENGLDADGVPIDAWFKTSPADLDEGNAKMDVWSFIPDFQRISGTLELQLEAFDYPNETAPIDSSSDTFQPGRGMVDLHVEARQLSLLLRSNELGGDFRLGQPRADTGEAGHRQ